MVSGQCVIKEVKYSVVGKKGAQEPRRQKAKRITIRVKNGVKIVECVSIDGGSANSGEGLS